MSNSKPIVRNQADKVQARDSERAKETCPDCGGAIWEGRYFVCCLTCDYQEEITVVRVPNDKNTSESDESCDSSC